MKEYKLTPKQESFALAIAAGETQAQAYRIAYDAENMSDKVIYNRASELVQNGGVAVRVKELREEQREYAMIDKYALTMKLEKSYELAMENRQCSAAVSAIMAIAKIHGLLTDKTDITTNGMPFDSIKVKLIK